MGSNTLVQADVWTIAQTEQGNVVLVRPKESNVAVPIFIGQLETQSILIGLGRVEMPRPLTHDLVLSVIAALGARLARIEISDLRDGTFFARIVLAVASGELVLDSRPSDAIAIAVRTKADVYIAESIVEEVGVPVDMIREAPQAERAEDAEEVAMPDSTLSWPTGAGEDGEPSRERALLEAELAAAIADEDYERAAAIRDRLKAL